MASQLDDRLADATLSAAERNTVQRFVAMMDDALGDDLRGRVATVAVKEFVFKQPVQIGDVLSFYVEVKRIGTTSVTVTVEVYAERRPSDPKVVKVTEATLTYVAIDPTGRPRAVPR